ncbi:MAG: PAS domain-containing protein [Nitrosospira sp.]|nr:PAS domain-containing protein [Nitrosospira sp.]
MNRVNNDFSNLLASIELAIVILHADLRIRRFTSAAKPLLNLIDTDIGRPLGNIRPNFELPDLQQRVRQVIDSMVPQSVELQDHDGHWYTLRMRPYRTLDNRIEGAVLAFIGIDSIKDAEHLRQALQQERRLAAVVRDASDAVTLQDFSGRILAWNRRATEMYGYSEEQALQLNVAVLIPDAARADMHVLRERLRQGETAPPCESLRRARDGRIFKVWLTTTVLLDDAGKPATIALTEREVV